MDKNKFKEITKNLILPRHPRQRADKARPVIECCPDCNLVVEGRIVEIYVRGFGTSKAHWHKKCLNCPKNGNNSDEELNNL